MIVLGVWFYVDEIDRIFDVYIFFGEFEGDWLEWWY